MLLVCLALKIPAAFQIIGQATRITRARAIMAMSEAQEAQALAASLRRPLSYIPAAGIRSADRHVGAPYSTDPIGWKPDSLRTAVAPAGATAHSTLQPAIAGKPYAVPTATSTAAAALGGSYQPTAWATWQQAASEAQYPRYLSSETS